MGIYPLWPYMIKVVGSSVGTHLHLGESAGRSWWWQTMKGENIGRGMEKWGDIKIKYFPQSSQKLVLLPDSYSSLLTFTCNFIIPLSLFASV